MAVKAENKFLVHVNALSDLLAKGRYQKDKASSLYKNGARNIVFRLEALCRLYRGIHNKTFFDKWYKEFKALEDTLGAMDHHHAMHVEFSAYKPLKKSSDQVLYKCLEEETGFLNDVLKTNGWLNGEALGAFLIGLKKANWLDAEEDSIAYTTGVHKELKKLDKKYRSGDIDLDLLEEGLHEFRRRLRWVSIYASTSDGILQLRQVKDIPKSLEKYCTDEIVKSPYNVLSKAAKGQKTIHISAPHFYATSWLIQHLGELKDIGLRYQTFLELCRVAGLKESTLMAKFEASCDFPPADVAVMAKEAVDHFILHHGVLEELMTELDLA